MEQLELKHLSFENGGKISLNKGSSIVTETVYLKQCSVHYHPIRDVYFLEYEGTRYRMDEIKPHRRPLSDLTKEIEHNGERFIPYKKIDHLFDIELDVDSSDVYHIIKAEDDGYHIISLFDNYQIIQKLLEWKFNVFNLPKELWIDVNTLEINPYK